LLQLQVQEPGVQEQLSGQLINEVADMYRMNTYLALQVHGLAIEIEIGLMSTKPAHRRQLQGMRTSAKCETHERCSSSGEFRADWSSKANRDPFYMFS